MQNNLIRQRIAPQPLTVERGGSSPGTAAASLTFPRDRLHERLRAAHRAMGLAQSDLAYLDAKEAFDDAARALAVLL